MIQALRERVHDWVYRPRLDWVQVEVTTDCTARCRYCPSALLGADWPRRHMPLSTFETILPTIARSTSRFLGRRPLVHLQGWGEPLRHPDFLAMLGAAKRAGLRVGTTTSGLGLDSDMARRLVDAGLDLISLSVAGIDAETNDDVRRGTRFARVLDGIAALDAAKRTAGRPVPEIHVSYMLLRSGIDAIERIPDAFAGIGVSEVIVSTLTVVVGVAPAAEALTPRFEAEYETLSARLDKAAARAAARGLRLHYRLRRPGRPPGLCTENVQASLLVTVDGRVTPCVVNRFAADGSGFAAEPFDFGDLTRESLADIWWKTPYVAFRNSFWNGRPPARCLACPKLGTA